VLVISQKGGGGIIRLGYAGILVTSYPEQLDEGGAHERTIAAASAKKRYSEGDQPCGHGLTTRGNDPDPKSSYLGPQYRRLRTKLGAPKAITAMAHRLARLAYRMLKYGQEYVDKGAQFYEQRLREQQLQLLKKKAVSLGLQLVPTEDVG
jgi:hypothetical protein